jgi:polysaccharide pyruvyl transferase WcaK-like protein
MKVAVLHGYSASNAGDGLLVLETLGLLREAFPGECQISVVALHPETFKDIDAHVIDGSVSFSGYSRELRDFLRDLDSFDLVVAVGGGYLRAGHLIEAAKTTLVHWAQVRAIESIEG